MWQNVDRIRLGDDFGREISFTLISLQGKPSQCNPHPRPESHSQGVLSGEISLCQAFLGSRKAYCLGGFHTSCLLSVCHRIGYLSRSTEPSPRPETWGSSACRKKHEFLPSFRLFMNQRERCSAHGLAQNWRPASSNRSE